MSYREDTSEYNDIISLTHPTSVKHPRMSLRDRASQFAPFSALTGHKEAIEETARLTDNQLNLDPDVISDLNEKLQIINENIGTDNEITFTIFVPDLKKQGGLYQEYTGIVRKYDEINNTLIMRDKTIVEINKIIDIKSDLFDDINF